MVSELCKGCAYYAVKMRVCDYLSIMHHSRGCPSGDKCTKYLPREKATYSDAWVNKNRIALAKRMKEGDSVVRK